MGRPRKINKEELKKLIKKKPKPTSDDLAKHFKCTRVSINRFIRVNPDVGQPLRTKSIVGDDLKKLEKHVDNGLNGIKIAELMNYAPSSIYRAIERNKIDYAKHANQHGYSYNITEEWLEKEISDGVSVHEMAGKLECDINTIYSRVKEYDLDLSSLERRETEWILKQKELAKQELKTCSKCGETKSITEFCKHKKGWDGLYCHCDVCVKEKRAENYSDPVKRAKILESCKKYRQSPEGKEKNAARAAKRWRENKEALRAYYADWISTGDNHEKTLKQKRNRHSKIREEDTRLLNEFFQENNVPECNLTENEGFGREKDFQMALAHIIAREFKLYVWTEKHFDPPENSAYSEASRLDIFLPEIKFIIETKLDSAITQQGQTESIKEQAARYSEHHETVVVSPKGEHEGWDSDCKWVNPDELFKLILEKCESNLTPN